MSDDLLRLGDHLYRVVGPPWHLQRSAWPQAGWLPVGQSGEPLVLGGADPADFLTTDDGDIIMVEDNRG